MKKVITALVFLSCLNANAASRDCRDKENKAQILSTFSFVNQNKKIQTTFSAGFGDNGFQSPTAACFIGDINKVCNSMKGEEVISFAKYAQGGHGYFKIKSCALATDDSWHQAHSSSVKVSYIQVTDYDEPNVEPKPIEIELYSCTGNRGI
jgi:hypothetical protein